MSNFFRSLKVSFYTKYRGRRETKIIKKLLGGCLYSNIASTSAFFNTYNKLYNPTLQNYANLSKYDYPVSHIKYIIKTRIDLSDICRYNGLYDPKLSIEGIDSLLRFTTYLNSINTEHSTYVFDSNNHSISYNEKIPLVEVCPYIKESREDTLLRMYAFESCCQYIRSIELRKIVYKLIYHNRVDRVYPLYELIYYTIKTHKNEAKDIFKKIEKLIDKCTNDDFILTIAFTYIMQSPKKIIPIVYNLIKYDYMDCPFLPVLQRDQSYKSIKIVSRQLELYRDSQ